MKPCEQCNQQNQDDARFCYQCGTSLSVTTTSQPVEASLSPQPRSNQELWQEFIGPNADRYLEQFKKFGSERAPRFALTWHWPAFLFISFLWFLYRKMYLYALVYALGPVISTYLTGDLTVGIVWSIMAGATANYLYYWHCREQIGEIAQKTWNDPQRQDTAIKEAGGVQPYVIWVGVAFYVLFTMVMVKMVQEEMNGDHIPTKPRPAAASRA